MPRILCLKGFWAFFVRADVSQCFHRASTEADMATGVADLAAGTAVSPKNAERFAENGERFILGTAILPLTTAISVMNQPICFSKNNLHR